MIRLLIILIFLAANPAYSVEDLSCPNLSGEFLLGEEAPSVITLVLSRPVEAPCSGLNLEVVEIKSDKEVSRQKMISYRIDNKNNRIGTRAQISDYGHYIYPVYVGQNMLEIRAVKADGTFEVAPPDIIYTLTSEGDLVIDSVFEVPSKKITRLKKFTRK